MENTALLVAIIQNAIDGIITINQKGIVELINPAACALFDYQPEEVIGKNVSMLMPDPHQNQHDNFISCFHSARKTNPLGIGLEVIGLRKDGSVFPFRLGLSEVQFSERRIFTGFIHDLSKEKEAERKLKNYATHLEELVDMRTATLNDTVNALQIAQDELKLVLDKEKELNLLKSRFVSMASHEFRTPLTSITTSASLIEKYTQSLQTNQVIKHVRKIKNATVNLTNILNDFLSLEKLEAGKEVVNLSAFDVVKFSEEITEEMQVMAKKNQTIIYLHAGVKSRVVLDKNLLKNCINNLITNAIKYSGENSFIDFNTETNDTHCIITVKDNDIGIPEADQKHLFEAFFRAHNTGTIPGTGLGLNIVTRYAGLMNGTVVFKSEVNQGTLFTISFPNNE